MGRELKSNIISNLYDKQYRMEGLTERETNPYDKTFPAQTPPWLVYKRNKYDRLEEDYEFSHIKTSKDLLAVPDDGREYYPLLGVTYSHPSRYLRSTSVSLSSTGPISCTTISAPSNSDSYRRNLEVRYAEGLRMQKATIGGRR